MKCTAKLGIHFDGITCTMNASDSRTINGQPTALCTAHTRTFDEVEWTDGIIAAGIRILDGAKALRAWRSQAHA